MKLLQINSAVNTGSVGRIVENIGCMAIARGWDSYIGYGRGKSNDSKNKLIKIGSSFDIYLHLIFTRILDRHGFLSKRATKKFLKEVDRISPDIVHLHNIHGYYINIELLFNYLERRGIPVVWTLHDCWSITGHCVHFDYVKCDKWKQHCFRCPQKKTYPKSLILDASRRNYHNKKALFTSLSNLTIVPVSNWLKNIVHASYLKKYPIKVLHNGIDLQRFKVNDDFLEVDKKYNFAGKFVILGVANPWVKRKGLDDFFKLSKILDDSIKIVLVGLKKNQINNLPNNIIPIFKTENIDQLAELYSRADLFVNPTYEDSFPTTNLEALACGTPIVTYNTGGSIESVFPSTGWIVEKGDFNGLHRVILNLQKEDFATRINRRQMCRIIAEEKYNKDASFRKYFEIYDTIEQ